MTIKASGGSNNLKFSEIESEFGQNTQRSLGDYRVSETNGSLSNMPLDTGIPQSGQIKFSDFYSKKLNIVVDFYSDVDGTTEKRKSARNNKYNYTATSTGQSNGRWRVVGGFRNRPTDSGEAPTGGVRGKKVFINVNKTLGSNSSSTQTVCALRTGNWQSETDLVVDIGGNGKIYGGGGAGGKGDSKENPSGINGGDGNSALGITYSGTTVNIASGGLICMGYGGGGGGGTGYNKDRGHPHRYGSGSGGGGGAGFPGGAGGEKTNTDGNGETGTDGTAGSLPNFSNGGQPSGGGRGGLAPYNSHWWEARGGVGGVGGPGATQLYENLSAGDPSTTGGDYASGPEDGHVGNQNGAGGGNAGNNGAAIRRTSGISVTINGDNSNTVKGSKTATGVS